MPPELSVILPIYNEEVCVDTVLRELVGFLDAFGRPYEALAVDDGSSDGTPAKLAALRAKHPALRVLTLTPNSGQSAAFEAGFRRARAPVFITMDADGQNDPSDIPRLLDAMAEADCVCGYRVNRQDTASKQRSSRWANAIRNRVLREDIIDTGCSLKAFRAEFVRDIPMWKGMHRFLGSFVRMKGGRIVQLPVNHRMRAGGDSKYTNWGRLKQTVWDLMAVRWMIERTTPYTVIED